MWILHAIASLYGDYGEEYREENPLKSLLNSETPRTAIKTQVVHTIGQVNRF